MFDHHFQCGLGGWGASLSVSRMGSSRVLRASFFVFSKLVSRLFRSRLILLFVFLVWLSSTFARTIARLYLGWTLRVLPEDFLPLLYRYRPRLRGFRAFAHRLLAVWDSFSCPIIAPRCKSSVLATSRTILRIDAIHYPGSF